MKTIEEQNIQEWIIHAKQGSSKAQFNLGLAFYRGIAVEKDYIEAFRYFYKAARQGHPGAQFHIALYYDKGILGKQNFEKAVEWYTKAAENKQVNAQCNLGLCYLDGEGVIQNYEEAIKWLKNAANQNNIQALLLAECYEKGLGVDSSQEMSEFYLEKVKKITE